MTEPVIVPRPEHQLSRRDIDSDALKVLYKLHESGYIAYLVGGSVRDLLLGRRPKDFDIGTSAHPYQVKKLFRNCWIIGRRFRLAHVRFGPKAIEVATFRKIVVPGTEAEPSEHHQKEPADAAAGDLLIRHDNTFGTSEEDAFRRDFTINALFYDIGTFAIIDYVGGLQDLRDGLIRCIGDPNERFQEDPVRMLRAVVMASRLGFRLDPPVVEAIAKHRGLMATASPSRLIEEYYKVLRSGAAEQTFRSLAEHRLLEPTTPELQRGAKNQALWDALAALDAHRRRFEGIPASLTNPVILGTLLVPLGLMPKRDFADPAIDETADDEGVAASTPEDEQPANGVSRSAHRRRTPKAPILKIGSLPIARGDTERLRQLLSLQQRIADVDLTPRAKRALLHRGGFQDALTWFEIHGQEPAVLEHWKGFIEALGPEALHPPAGIGSGEGGRGGDRPAGTGRRRRGRRRRGRGGFSRPPES